MSDVTDTDKVYSYLDMEAALCIYEWLIEDVLPLDSKHPNAKAWQTYCDSVGSTVLRYNTAAEYAPWVLRVYDAALEIDPYAWENYFYDWEIVPEIMSKVEFIPEPMMSSDYDAVARSVLTTIVLRRNDASTET